MIVELLPKHYHKNDAALIMDLMKKIYKNHGALELQYAQETYARKYIFLTNGLLNDPKRNNQIPRKKCNAWLRRYLNHLNETR